MSEPQHPQPQDTESNIERPVQSGARATVQPVAQNGLESPAAMGARLTQLRESKGLAIEDVSARLKVSLAKLRALEAGDLSKLPDTTFLLGVVRSYAKMLGADPTPFAQVLRRERGVPEPDLSMPASSGTDLPRGRVSLSLGSSGPKHRSWLWGVAAAIVALIALAMWHTNGGDSSAWLARLKAGANGAAADTNGASGAVAQGQSAGSEAAPADQSAASAPQAQAAANDQASDAAQQAPAALASASQAMAAPTTPAAQANSPAVAPQGAPAVPAKPATASAVQATQAAAGAASDTAATPADQSTVALRVTQDSWISVRQKDGKEVFSGLVHPGDAKEVSGQTPFKVTVGNKAGLESITLNGQPVDPSKYAGAIGNVARFALP